MFCKQNTLNAHQLSLQAVPAASTDTVTIMDSRMQSLHGAVLTTVHAQTCLAGPPAHAAQLLIMVHAEACNLQVCCTQRGQGSVQMLICTADAVAGGALPYGVV